MKTGRKTKAQLVKELEALRKINATIGTLLHLDIVLQRIIDEMIPLFAAQAASVILFDYTTQEAEITTVYGKQSSPKRQPLRYAWRGSLAGWIVEHRRSLRLARLRTEEWPTSAKLAKQLGGSLETISVLLVPLWQNDAVIGCLEIVWDPQRDITDGDEQLGETIATQITIAITNARLYQEKELALQAAKETENRYRDLVDNSEGLICTHDLKGVLLSVNPAVARAFRAQPDELVGRNLVELLAPSVRQFFPAYLAQIQQETRVRGLMRVLTKDGEERVLVFHNIRREEPGREPYVVGHGQDITALEQAKEELRRLHTAVQMASDGISIIGLDGRVLYSNGAVLRRAGGMETNDIVGNPVRDFIAPEDLERAQADIVQLQTAGQLPPREYQVINKAGGRTPVEITLTMLRSRSGKPSGIIAITRDITERKRAEEALRESEERTRSIIEAALDAVISIDEDGQIIGWNRQAEHIFGWPREEAMGQDLRDMIIPVLYRAAHKYGLQCFTQTGAGNLLNKRIEVPALHRNGTEFPVELSILPVRWKERWTYTAFVRDISEQKQAEQALRDSEERYRIVSQSISDFAFSLRLEADGTSFLEWMTDSFTKVTGYPVEEFLGKPNPGSTYIHPEDHGRISEIVRQLPTNTSTTYEFRVILSNGETRWMRAYVYAVREEIDNVTHIYGAAQDITERKEAAERQQQLQAQLLQTQKLEAVGTLAGGVAHDFNNILTAIVGYTELAMDDVPVNSQTYRNLENVLTGSRRAKGLIQQLLTFSRPSHQDRRPVSLYKIIEGTITLLRVSLAKSIDIRITQSLWMDTILANPTQIEQIVMNLCVNAAYAIGEREGVIEIGIDSVVAERSINLGCPDASMGTSVCLTVSDTGCGMAPEMLERIFEPFFTTKPIGQGSGMGLAIVHAIVTSHGGSITVESHFGQGTTFRLYFPSLQEPAVINRAQAA